ncbi:MAG: hypothetical protein NT141_02900 [candidate division WWE3 bacterium]|nr:hypothetical protein [candidate division WWE3 bacterium]
MSAIVVNVGDLFYLTKTSHKHLDGSYTPGILVQLGIMWFQQKNSSKSQEVKRAVDYIKPGIVEVARYEIHSAAAARKLNCTLDQFVKAWPSVINRITEIELPGVTMTLRCNPKYPHASFSFGFLGFMAQLGLNELRELSQQLIETFNLDPNETCL